MLIFHFALRLSTVEGVKLRQLAWFRYLEDVLPLKQKDSSVPLKDSFRSRVQRLAWLFILVKAGHAANNTLVKVYTPCPMKVHTLRYGLAPS